jgi:DNA polymerase-3 subunit epsilon
MVRREAYQRIVDLGGRVADNVSKKVNILVVADLDPVVIGEDGRSGKLRKAIALAEKGEPIELMDARDFIRILS